MNRNELLRYIKGYILGVSIFLLLIPAIIFLSSYFTASLFPYPVFYDDRISAILSLLICIPGVVFMIWSNVYLLLIGKGGPTEGFGIEVSPKTKILVTTGPYKYTRNPMVFGAYSMYLSFALLLNSYVSLMLVFLFFPFIIIYLKKSEEKRLVEDFGVDFLKYRKSVSLLIPLPPKEKLIIK